MSMRTLLACKVFRGVVISGRRPVFDHSGRKHLGVSYPVNRQALLQIVSGRPTSDALFLDRTHRIAEKNACGKSSKKGLLNNLHDHVGLLRL